MLLPLRQVAWLLFNAAGVWMFGVAHQGGVVPGLQYAGGRVASAAAAGLPAPRVITAHTYSPPASLLGVRHPQCSERGPCGCVEDVGGASMVALARHIGAAVDTCPAGAVVLAPRTTRRQVLAALQAVAGQRGWGLETEGEPEGLCLRARYVWHHQPHFSGEAPPALHGGALWWQLALEAWEVRVRECASAQD